MATNDPNDPFNLATGYGFQKPPDEAMIQALLGQMELGNNAKFAQPRLEKQMSQAEALRDREAPKSTHWLSGVAQLGNKAAGIRDVRATEKQQIAGEQALGNSLAAQQKYQMEGDSRAESNALANTRLALSQREEDHERKVEAARLKAAALAKHQSAERANKDVEETDAAQRISTLDGRDLTANYKNGTWVTPDGETLPQDQVYVPGPRKQATAKERAYMRDVGYKSDITEKYMSKDLSYWSKVAQPIRMADGKGVPTELINAAIREGETQGLYDYLNGKEVLGFKIPGSGVSKEEREAILESTRALSDLMANVVNPFIEDSIAGAASDDDVKRMLGAIRIQGGGSGEELMQQTNQLLSRIRTQVREQSSIYANDGDLSSHRQGRDALKHLDDGDKRIAEGRMTPEARIAAEEPAEKEYPEGVTKEAHAEATAMIAAQPEQRARLEAYVEQNPGAQPAWEFALEQLREKEQKISELRQPMQ